MKMLVIKSLEYVTMLKGKILVKSRNSEVNATLLQQKQGKRVVVMSSGEVRMEDELDGLAEAGEERDVGKGTSRFARTAHLR